MSFIHYKNIKNKICLVYHGNNPEYIIQLRLIRPFLQEKYPEVEFNFACREQHIHYLREEPHKIATEKLHQNDGFFAYKILLTYDAATMEHPIMKLLKESNIPVQKYKVKGSVGKNGFICTQGHFPSTPLDSSQINYCQSWIRSRGFTPIIVNESCPHIRWEMVKTAGFVVGVECDMIYEGIGLGIPTAITGNSNGREIYESLCEKAILLNI